MPHGVPDREALQDEQHGLKDLFGQKEVKPDAQRELGEFDERESENEHVQARDDRVFARDRPNSSPSRRWAGFWPSSRRHGRILTESVHLEKTARALPWLPPGG